MRYLERTAKFSAIITLLASSVIADANIDLNEDGVVNVNDLAIFRLLYFSAPGPSGIPNSCQSI